MSCIFRFLLITPTSLTTLHLSYTGLVFRPSERSQLIPISEQLSFPCLGSSSYLSMAHFSTSFRSLLKCDFSRGTFPDHSTYNNNHHYLSKPSQFLLPCGMSFCTYNYLKLNSILSVLCLLSLHKSRNFVLFTFIFPESKTVHDKVGAQ